MINRQLCLRLVLVLGLLCTGLAATATTAKPAAAAQISTLTVRADQPLGKINPFVYGANDGPWALVPPDMFPKATASGITFLRFPAGDWGDENELTPFHVDLFMKFARLMKAEPSIHVRLKNGTPEAAAELVRYTNIEKKYGVRYWSVGNEPNLFPGYSIEKYVRDWRVIAEAMLAVDPAIQFIGPDTSQYPAPEETGAAPEKFYDWVRGFLKANGDLVKIVAVHRYPFAKSMNANATTIAELKESAREWDSIIPHLRKLIKENAGRDLPVAITEVSSHWNKVIGGEATPDSFYHAIWWADVLGRLIRQKVDIVAYFTLYTGGDLGAFGMMGRYDVRPTYYVYPLYRQLGDELFTTESTDPDVTITAARRSDGALTLMVVNPAMQAKSVGLRLLGITVGWNAELWRLDPDHKAEKIGTVNLGTNMLDLTAQSVSLYIISSGTASSAGSQANTAPTAAATSPATPAPTSASNSTAALYKDPKAPVEQRVADLLARMTLEEKIGQMTLVEKDSVNPPDITSMALGGLLSGGGGSPKGNNTPQGWAAMVDSFQKLAMDTRLGIPMIYGVDAVHGHGNLRGATVFPHNIGLGAIRDPKLVEQIAQATAKEMIATGIYWNYSPVLAVVQDLRWGRTYESFSENTDLVSTLGVAMVKGLHGPALGGQYSVLATPKHFVGDGGTKWGSSTTEDYKIDQGVTEVDEKTLRAIHLPPYIAAVKSGAMSIMVSFSSWGGMKMHAQRYLLTDVLKKEIGFTGFLVSDWQGIDQIPGEYYQDVVTAINAGIDMNMVPYKYQLFVETLQQAVEKGDVPMARIDDAVTRILRVKFMMGLFEHPYSDPALLETVGSAPHRALAREAVTKSLVLLKNDANALPLAKNPKSIFVAGEAADDIGYQSGGWTIDWQGRPGNITTGTTILAGIEEAVSEETSISYERLGHFLNANAAQDKPIVADVGIVVVAEKPYAEGKGDRANLVLSDADISLIQRMRERSKKLVVILLSGRPLVITDQLAMADAFVAAWLPGTEGAGVTDALFGDKPFSGKLPFTWPRTVDQIPFDFANLPTTGQNAPLFPFGYGLTR